MNRRSAVVFLLLLLPSLIAAWSNRDMPHFGWGLHDDGIYFSVAKSWAAGEGHRIPNLPQEPWQTKYPPLFPLILAGVWRIAPEFPGNLQLATAVAWLFIPAILLLYLALLERYGLTHKWALCMVAVLGLNPYIGYFGRSLLSETPYTMLLLLVFLVGPRSSWMAGAIAGLAYLTRASALPLVVAYPAYFLWRGERRNAVLFVAAMLPFVVGWAAWSTPRKLRGEDPYILYFVDYLWAQLYNVNLGNFTLILKKNVNEIFTTMAGPVIPLASNAFEVAAAQAIGVGSAVGVWRLARERHAVVPYALYAVAHVLLLAVWHFPADGRLVFPIFPLLLAGLSTEVGRVVAAAYKVRNDRSQRVAVAVFTAVLAIFVVIAVRNQIEVTRTLPLSAANDRAMTSASLACAARFRDSTPAGESLVVDNDALVHLFTGRHAMRLVVPFHHWYEGTHQEAKAAWPDVARRLGFRYLMTNSDFDPGLARDDRNSGVASWMGRPPELETLFSCGQTTVYRILPVAYRATPARN